MSDSSRRRNIAEAHGSMRTIAKNLPRLRATFDAEALGATMQAGQGRGQTNAITDRTGNAAINDSKARSDERQLDRLLRSLASTARAAEIIVTYWLTDIPAKADELAALERAADPGCEVLAKVGAWEPAHRQSTTVGGRLPRAYRLGRWAYDFVGKNDRLPTEAECKARAEGRTVYVTAGT